MSFGTVRSAEVQPGTSFLARLAAATPPTGRDAGRFWVQGGGSIPASDVALTFGRRPESGQSGRSFEFSAGIGGILVPYLDGYVQLADEGNPFGIGGRLGIPVMNAGEYQIYVRYDVPLEEGKRIVLNPTLLAQGGVSDVSATYFIGVSQGVGYMSRTDRVTFVPSASLVVGRVTREVLTTDEHFPTVFAVLSFRMSFHGER